MYNTLTYFQVNVYEEDLSKWPADRRILIIYFSDQANAVRWLNSDKYFKNDDFPQPSDTLQIFLIPVHYTADKGTVHWPISQLYTLYLAATHYYSSWSAQLSQRLRIQLHQENVETFRVWKKAWI